MSRYPFQQVASKWLKTRVLARNEALAHYLPKTVRWHPDKLFTMLSQFGLVFLKPDKGGGGFGVFSVERLERNRYEVRYGTKRQTIADNHSLVAFLRRKMPRGRRYLMQQGIRLATVAGRPFDIRIIVQKPEKNWVVTGMAAKVAPKEKIVTNRSRGGIAVPVAKAVGQSFGWTKDRVHHLERQLTSIALHTAYTLEQQFRQLRVLGLDVGLNQAGNPWIFEVNTRPQFQLFLRIDPKGYRNIVDNQKKMIADWRKKNGAFTRKRRARGSSVPGSVRPRRS